MGKLYVAIVSMSLTLRTRLDGINGYPMGGRESLLAFMQTVMLPMATCQLLNRIARNFLWESSEDYSYNHLVHWDAVCLPKSQGRWGLSQLEILILHFSLKLGES